MITMTNHPLERERERGVATKHPPKEHHDYDYKVSAKEGAAAKHPLGSKSTTVTKHPLTNTTTTAKHLPKKHDDKASAMTSTTKATVYKKKRGRHRG
jgi:hypothetical protein